MNPDPSAPPPSYEDALKHGQTPPIGFNNPSNSHQLGPVPANQIPLMMNPYPHPQVPQQQQQQMPQQQYIANQPPPTPAQIIIMPAGGYTFGRHPSRVVCPACLQSTTTRVKHESTCHTHTIAFLLCFFQFWCLSCLPYCIDSCKNTVHYCGNCGQYLGTYANGIR